MTEVSEVLEAAAELISGPGKWGQGAREITGDHCADTAIWFAAGGPYAPDFALINAAEAALAASLKLTPTPTAEIAIHRWNDAPERTQAEVVQALKDAARLAKGRG